MHNYQKKGENFKIIFFFRSTFKEDKYVICELIQIVKKNNDQILKAGLLKMPEIIIRYENLLIVDIT